MKNTRNEKTAAQIAAEAGISRRKYFYQKARKGYLETIKDKLEDDSLYQEFADIVERFVNNKLKSINPDMLRTLSEQEPDKLTEIIKECVAKPEEARKTIRRSLIVTEAIHIFLDAWVNQAYADAAKAAGMSKSQYITQLLTENVPA